MTGEDVMRELQLLGRVQGESVVVIPSPWFEALEQWLAERNALAPAEIATPNGAGTYHAVMVPIHLDTVPVVSCYNGATLDRPAVIPSSRIQLHARKEADRGKR